MLTGFNTDIDCAGVTYHVQTEDRTGAGSLIESLVYVGGEILATRRTDYRNLVEAGANRISIQALMERQHRAIVDTIRTGRIDLLTEPLVGAEGDTTVRRRPLLDADMVAGEVERRSSKSLDEVIAEWLAEQAAVERVRMVVEGGEALRYGHSFTLKVHVHTLPGEAPLAGAAVVARFLSTAQRPHDVAEATTDGGGAAVLKGSVPKVEKGTGLLVVTVHHERGDDEAKFLVQR